MLVFFFPDFSSILSRSLALFDLLSWRVGSSLGGWAPRTNGYVVNNHGDRFRPLNGVMGPLINGQTSWLINGGDPNHLLTGMILQAGHWKPDSGTQSKPFQEDLWQLGRNEK